MSKIAAIWARVSTPEQMSLESQVSQAKEKLENAGYIVPADRILSVDWTSPELSSCPDFQKLHGWIQRREIQALGIFDRDRLECEGIQRLVFLSICKEAGVEIVICHGSPILAEEEGQIVELALAIGKKRSVLRARQGAKDGLHYRAKKQGLPANHKKLYGYEWEHTTPEDLKLSRKLIPDKNWDTLKLMFDMAVRGATYYAIKKELERRGILSPTGFPKWDRSTIFSILNNPTYTGRYYALKREAVKPEKRVTKTYGNSSSRHKSLDEATYLPEVEVVNPPINWEQYKQIQERRKRNKELAKRNAKHDHLLRSFICCETHRGKRGESRKYFARMEDDKLVYKCPVGGCAHPTLHGPEIEEKAKEFTRNLLEAPTSRFYEGINSLQNKDEMERDLNKELKNLEQKEKEFTNDEAQLLLDRSEYGKKISTEAFNQALSIIHAKRKWSAERREDINDKLKQLHRQSEVITTLKELQVSIVGGLGELNDEQWRKLFIALNLEIHVRDKSDRKTWPKEWIDEGVEHFWGDWWIDIEFGIPLVPSEKVSEIVLNTPMSDCLVL